MILINYQLYVYYFKLEMGHHRMWSKFHNGDAKDNNRISKMDICIYAFRIRAVILATAWCAA